MDGYDFMRQPPPVYTPPPKERWRRFKRWVRIRWQGECKIEGCERAVVDRPYSSSGLCDVHWMERMRKVSDEAARGEFEREVRIAEEALRRVGRGVPEQWLFERLNGLRIVAESEYHGGEQERIQQVLDELDDIEEGARERAHR